MTTHLGLPPSPYLAGIVSANGILSLILGVAAIFKPLVFLDAFDIKESNLSPESKKVARDLLLVYAARDLALGFGLTAAGYYGHREIMGWSMVGVAVLATLDGVVSRGNRRGGEWKHWFFTVVSLGIAGGCFGYV